MHSFDRVDLTWEQAYALTFVVQVSKNGEKRTDAACVDNTAVPLPFNTADAALRVTDFEARTACYVRLSCGVRNTSWGNSRWSLAVVDSARPGTDPALRRKVTASTEEDGHPAAHATGQPRHSLVLRLRGPAKSVHDAGWSAFVTMLQYKAARYGRTFVKIGRFEPTSQVCSACGVKDGPKPLHVRVWTCTGCGAVLDRDVNAAVNLAKAAGLAVTARGAQVGPGLVPAPRGETGTHPTPQPSTARWAGIAVLQGGEDANHSPGHSAGVNLSGHM